MPKHRKIGKKQIDQYDHKEAKRINNPSVGPVTLETDRDAGKKIYAYDPHIDPRTIIYAVRKKNGDGKQMTLFELRQIEPIAALDYVFLTGCFGMIKYHL
jgi:hypothetical protein